MSLRCRLVDLDEIHSKGEILKPGDMWYSPVAGSDQKVLIVKLPCGDDFAPIHLGWDVTGEPPNITVSPSIMDEHYHGWIKDGVLTDDTDGRTYG